MYKLSIGQCKYAQLYCIALYCIAFTLESPKSKFQNPTANPKSKYKYEYEYEYAQGKHNHKLIV